VTTDDPRLTRLVAEVGDLPESRVVPDLRFTDLNRWGSLAALRLLTAIEETFDIHLDLRRYLVIETVGELSEMIAATVRPAPGRIDD
jgi:acyl carrier protein